ncbi:MAG TPA: hypothetical protein VFN67_29745 [Polyangiales bacterium]|nr:hypothetical protein [Polyangiales bacterium]
MWLVVGWPGVDKEQPEAKEIVGFEEAPKAIALREAPKLDAAAPEPEEPLYDEPPPPPASAPPQAPLGPPGDMLAGQRGPVEEYQALYDRQARDSAATEVEGAIGAAFKHSTRPDLLHSASCHESVCKVLIRWSPDRTRDYLQSMRWLALGTPWPPGQPGFDSQIAYTGASENDKDGGRLVEVYLKRMPPAAAKPAAHSH